MDIQKKEAIRNAVRENYGKIAASEKTGGRLAVSDIVAISELPGNLINFLIKALPLLPGPTDQ